MTFPDKLFSSMADYSDAYFGEYQKASASVDKAALTEAARRIEACYRRGATVFVCGNGGSTAIANHMVCDHGKLVQTDTDLVARVISLSNPTEMITAIGNDISYAEVFAYQLASLGRPGDVLVTISGSGDSPNVVRAIEVAREKGLESIAFTGFNGGRTAKMADVNLHVVADNYGIIEDVHQSLMQIIAQFIRLNNMPVELISERKF